MNDTEIIEGNRYVIDKKFRNSGEVILVKILGKYFCTVKAPDSDYEWDTMINRLSTIDNSQKQSPDGKE